MATTSAVGVLPKDLEKLPGFDLRTPPIHQLLSNFFGQLLITYNSLRNIPHQGNAGQRLAFWGIVTANLQMTTRVQMTSTSTHNHFIKIIHTWLGKHTLFMTKGFFTGSPTDGSSSLFSPFRMRMGSCTGGIPSAPKYRHIEPRPSGTANAGEPGSFTVRQSCFAPTGSVATTTTLASMVCGPLLFLM